jgi:hypothetical protein
VASIPKYFSRLNRDLGVFHVGALVWLLVFIWGYYDLRVLGDHLYGGEHTIFAAANKGMDFKAIYNYGTGLRSSFTDYVAASVTGARNVYPPFVTVVMLPFTFFSVDTAYHIFAFLLICSLFVMVYACLSESGFNTGVNRVILTLVIVAVLFNTYPVSFSVERGNSDIIAATFAALALLGMSRGLFLLSLEITHRSFTTQYYSAIYFGAKWCGCIHVASVQICKKPFFVDRQSFCLFIYWSSGEGWDHTSRN